MPQAASCALIEHLVSHLGESAKAIANAEFKATGGF
jgi:hypothetical protein